MDKKDVRHFNVLAVPCRRAFIVGVDKKEEQINFKKSERIISVASESNEDDLTKKTQHFDVLAVRCSRAFVIANDKKMEFLSQKADPKVIAEIESIASKLNVANLTNLNEKGPVLVKKRRNFNKT